MIETQKGEDYTCAQCGGVFTAEWTREEAEAEALEKFGIENAASNPDMVQVCDGCWKELGLDD